MVACDTKIIRKRSISKKSNLTNFGVFDVPAEMLIVELSIDVCDCMGANVVNTVVEKIAPYIEEISRARVGLKILSNLCTKRMAMA